MASDEQVDANFPSSTLKEKLLDLLQSQKGALESLANLVLMRSDHTHATVHELVGHYEENSGPLSLEMWKYLFKRLGLAKYFDELMAVDERTLMVDVTAMDNVDFEYQTPPSRQLSTKTRNDSINSPGKSMPRDQQDQSSDDSSGESSLKNNSWSNNGTAEEFKGAIIYFTLIFWSHVQFIDLKFTDLSICQDGFKIRLRDEFEGLIVTNRELCKTC